MSTQLPIFEELVASEAAIRGQSIIDKPEKEKHGFIEIGSRVFHSTENMDAGGDRDAIATALYDKYLKIYDYQFQDSSQHKKKDKDGKHYNTRHLSEAEQGVIRDIFKRFVAANYNEGGELTLTREDAPKALTELYKEINGNDVMLTHATMALGVMLVELGNGDKWKATTPKGIDFTRGEHKEEIIDRISDAINQERPITHSSDYIPPPGKDYIEVIGGLDFPVKMIDGPPHSRKHLVTESGYLVDLTNGLRKHIEDFIETGHPLSELHIPVPPDATHLAQYMDNKYFAPQPPGAKSTVPGDDARRSLAKNLKRMMNAKRIDNHPEPERAEAITQQHIFCLNMDLMTGLLMVKRKGEKQTELEQFKQGIEDYSAEHGNSIRNIIDLIPADAHPQFSGLTEASKEIERNRVRLIIKGKLMDISAHLADNEGRDPSLPVDSPEVVARKEKEAVFIERAADKLSETLTKVYESADKAFITEDGTYKQPPGDDQQRRVYFTQGGSGSGKGGLKKLARKECGDSLVVASLDDMRGDSDRLWLYPALEIHHEDYKSIGDFGNAVRDLTTRRAETNGYNLFIDGSGIPYANRNDKTVKEFKDLGYHVSVLGAQAPLSVYRKDGEGPDRVSDVVTMRGGARLQAELRGMPMPEIAKKHHGHPIAAHDAARDLNVDRFMIEDTSPAFGKSYTLSYVVDIPSKLFKAGLGKLEDQALHDALAKNDLIPEWVKWPEKLPGEDKIPAGMTKADVKVVAVKPGATPDDRIYHVEVITNLPQYVNMVQKGLYNVEAKGPEALFDNRISADINSIFKNGDPGRLRLQPALGVEEVKWPDYESPLRSGSPLDKRNMGTAGTMIKG